MHKVKASAKQYDINRSEDTEETLKLTSIVLPVSGIATGVA